jgi:hypothetical protein
MSILDRLIPGQIEVSTSWNAVMTLLELAMQRLHLRGVLAGFVPSAGIGLQVVFAAAADLDKSVALIDGIVEKDDAWSVDLPENGTYDIYIGQDGLADVRLSGTDPPTDPYAYLCEVTAVAGEIDSIDNDPVAKIWVPRIWGGQTEPEDPKVGDLWYDSAAPAFKTWNGAAWEIVPDGSIGTDQLADDAVTPAKLHEDCAGEGLVQAGDGSVKLKTRLELEGIRFDTTSPPVEGTGIATSTIEFAAGVDQIIYGSVVIPDWWTEGTDLITCLDYYMTTSEDADVVLYQLYAAVADGEDYTPASWSPAVAHVMDVEPNAEIRRVLTTNWGVGGGNLAAGKRVLIQFSRHGTHISDTHGGEFVLVDLWFEEAPA